MTLKNSSGPYLHGIQHEVGITKYNWLTWCQYNVTVDKHGGL